MHKWLFLGIFFVTSSLSATLFLSDERGFMDFEDFLAIQENHNLLKHKNNFYRLEISENNNNILSKKKRISSNYKKGDDYCFTIGWDDNNFFYLRKIDPLYGELLSTFPAALTMQLINESEQKLRTIIQDISDENLCKGCTLPARYYVALEILALRGCNEAKNKLAEECAFLQSHPQLILGASPEAHRKIEHLLKKRGQNLLLPSKKTRHERRTQYLEANQNHGTCLPLEYYKLLDTWDLNFEAKEALKHPCCVMGNSFSANKAIRELLWEHLQNKCSEKLIKTIFSYNLLNNKTYKSMSISAISLAFEDGFREWQQNPLETKIKGLKDYLPYCEKPEIKPETPEQFAYATFHATVCDDHATLAAFKERAQQIIDEGLNKESLEIFVCFLSLLDASKLRLKEYNYLVEYRENFSCISAFLEHTARLAVDNPEIIFGENEGENKDIRIMLMNYAQFDRTQKQFNYAEIMLRYPDSHYAALKLLFDYHRHCTNEEIKGNLALYASFNSHDDNSDIEWDENSDYDYSTNDDYDFVWHHIPVAVLQELKTQKKNPLYKEAISILFQQYSNVIDQVKDPESRRFLRTYLDKELVGISSLFES